MSLTTIEQIEVAMKDLWHAAEHLKEGDLRGAQEAIVQAEKTIHDVHLIVWQEVTTEEMKKRHAAQLKKR